MAGETSRTLEQMNAAQLKTIQTLTQEVKDAAIWQRFIGYLIDECEGQTVTEENLQSWMANMLEAEKTPAKK